MGREIRRVALDFDWPMHKVWYGFISPYQSSKCEPCDGGGYNPETEQIARAWYANGYPDLSRWCHAITLDELQALLDHNRLWDLYRTWTPGTGWSDAPTPKATQEMLDKVNVANGAGGPFLGALHHDAINRMICVEVRAKRLGVWGHCKWCKGHGELWSSPTAKKLCKTWRARKPPAGPGWQVWETVSEGSPVSPVFETPEALIDWLSTPAHRSDERDDQGYSRAAAESFVKGSGHVPSMVTDGRGGIFKDIECAAREQGGATNG